MSRKPPRKGRRTKTPLVPEPTTKEVKSPWLRKLAVAVGLMGAVFALYSHGDTARSFIDATKPQISLNTAEPQVPFALPFAIQNASDWFEMSEVRFKCHIVDMQLGNGGSITNSVVDHDISVTIERHSAPVNFRCGIDVARGIPVKSARIRAEVNYKTAWVIERKTEREFNWIAGRWIEGAVY